MLKKLYHFTEYSCADKILGLLKTKLINIIFFG